MQRPQRTLPPRASSCVGVTRNRVLQRGQRVSRLICCANTSSTNGGQEHPTILLTRRLEIVPGSIRFRHFSGLHFQYAGKRETAAARIQVRNERCEHHERL